ncbi:MAG: hypothetical protein HYV93_25945 [Candidatus Rokubacteria bacterium]|nr:hypothetical protein [Candidatus Rokubacteria bacterium]
MSRIMRRVWIVALAGIALWPVTSQPAAAASFALTEREQKEAIGLGRRSVVSEVLGDEWTSRNGSGDTLTVVTPFHRLAQAARIAAFKKAPLKPREIGAVLKATAGRLTLWVTLRGGKPDFARFLEPALLDGKIEVKPSFVQNEQTALRGEDGRFSARCLYVFPAARLDPRGRFTLLIRDPDEKELSRFTVDLSAMR